MTGLQLTPIQFGVLAHLTLDTETTQAGLARSVLIRPQSIAPLLDAMEQRGWVTRTGARTRGRRNPVQITALGRQTLTDAWTVATSANDLRDLGLDFEESGQLTALLTKVLHATNGAAPKPTDDLWQP